MQVAVTLGFSLSLGLITTACGSDGAAGGSSTLTPTTTATYCEAACADIPNCLDDTVDF